MTDVQALAQQLATLGYVAPVPRTQPGAAAAPVPVPTDVALVWQAARKFLIAMGQEVGPNPMPQAAELLRTAPRCGCPDVMAAGTGLCQWSHAPVTVAQSVRLTQFTAEQVGQAFADALAAWEAVCGIAFEYAGQQQANITARSGPIDGPGRTLAWSHLPCGAGESTALSQLYDTGETWPSLAYLRGTMIHELGHAIGLDHSQDARDIMYPMMRPNVLTPGPGDIAAARQRYGSPRQTPTPQPPPTPQPSGLPVVTLPDGRRFEVAGRWL